VAILLLDEPTNYLDAESVAWRKQTLGEAAKMTVRRSCALLLGVPTMPWVVDETEPR
jgi:hypothetical protein